MELITIRKADRDDLDELLQFEQGVIEAERPFDPTLANGKILYYDIEQLISSLDTELVVAESESRIVGSGYARIEKAKAYNSHEYQCYLGFMYVSPDYRGKGVIRKIIDHLKVWSVKKGIYELRLDVYDGNSSAINAYEKSGFSKHMVNMRIDLGS